jgi:hypothetical protein
MYRIHLKVTRCSPAQNGSFKIRGGPSTFFEKNKSKTGDFSVIRKIKKEKTRLDIRPEILF